MVVFFNISIFIPIFGEMMIQFDVAHIFSSGVGWLKLPTKKAQFQSFPFPQHPWDWSIYLHLPYKSTINVSKYPMDPMGTILIDQNVPWKSTIIQKMVVNLLEDDQPRVPNL